VTTRSIRDGQIVQKGFDLSELVRAPDEPVESGREVAGTC
jgi:hypothetical protein